MDDIEYIDNDAALADFCQRIAGAGFMALDTEFIREKTYYPRLCLVQIAAGNDIACIDPFCITDFSPLRELFRNEDILKVLHSASQDMEVFLHDFGCLPVPVYDTQVAASLMGMGDQVAYARLVKEMLDVQLDKSHTRTDWSRRPLDDAQIRYAADDVRYLVRLFPMQRDSLQAQGRLAWLEEDFRDIVDESRYRPDPGRAWRKIKGAQRLSRQELAILKMLAAWRERQAMIENKPRKFILSNDLLLDLVKSKPGDIRSLERRRGVTPGLARRRGEELVSVIKEAMDIPRDQWPELPRGKPLGDRQEVIADILMSLLRYQAKVNKVSAGSLASKKDIERLVRGKQDIPLLHGWRYEMGGRMLQQFMQGEIRISLADNELLIEGGRNAVV